MTRPGIEPRVSRASGKHSNYHANIYEYLRKKSTYFLPNWVIRIIHPSYIYIYIYIYIWREQKCLRYQKALYISCLNFLNEAWWFLSLRFFGLLSSSLEGRRTYRPKRSGINNKYEDNKSLFLLVFFVFLGRVKETFKKSIFVVLQDGIVCTFHGFFKNCLRMHLDCNDKLAFTNFNV